MKAKNSLTPYPILSEQNDDYVRSSFSAEVEADVRYNKFILNVTFTLKNKGLEELIRSQHACFVVHVESAKCSFRQQYLVDYTKNCIEIEIAENLLDEVVQICTFIVATRPIVNYSNTSFHPDYSGISFSLAKGNILAIGPSYQDTLLKKQVTLEDLKGIVKIAFEQLSPSQGDFFVDTDNSECIFIRLDEKLREPYMALGRNSFKSTIFSLLFIPAMQIILFKMRAIKKNETDDIDDETSKHWFIVLDQLIATNVGANFDLTTADDNMILNVVQKLFSNPIRRSLAELAAYRRDEE